MHPIRRDDRVTLTIAEAAELAGRSRSWVRCWRDLGVLVPVDIDGRHGVTLASLQDLMIWRPRPVPKRALRIVGGTDFRTKN